MRFKLSFLLILSLIVMAMADSSDSSDDDKHGNDEHSGDEEEKEHDGKDKATEKEKEKKETKLTKSEEEYDETQSKITGSDIDSMFGDHDTEKPSDGTTPEPPQVFTKPSSMWDFLGDEDDDDTTVKVTTPAPSKEEPGPNGTHGNPFFPYPRPVDIWDRLFVLAAFPICFFAVMLKAHMFR
ncbi:Secreted phosphoprotein 1 [Caenorhabditis elegans]|uniref:Secreted phosphoprotein 1 n=1 Tax=Caenorhabditis elegans TaxID=6239 RepID=Q19871_CAEEL|nr:Secreted phosphoprotein 1 [Caenorhabditis elegans]CAA94595.2 Secreted phosphoprotein 1 [Caenorhabditis elegans]|eukprot:NP_502363.2 Uncharacterized protein CELE_F28D1.6 [Caenorhabditis elegans]